MGLQNGSPLRHILSILNLATWTGSRPLFPRCALRERVGCIDNLFRLSQRVRLRQ
jgi:hypothetical protein